MRTVFDKIAGHTLDDDLELHGMAVGELIVPQGRMLILNGMVTGDLVIEAGGQADVNGTVTGAVRNEGGKVRVFGVVGRLIEGLGARTVIDDNAIIRSR